MKILQEGQNAKLELNHDPPECVAAMVHFLYLLDYTVPEDSGGTQLTFHVRMAVLADKYDIRYLKDTAVNHFAARAQWVGYAFEHRRSKVDTTMKGNIEDLAVAVDEAYEYYTATEPIRKAMQSVVLDYPSLLAKETEEGVPKRAIMLKHPGFATDVAELFAVHKKTNEDQVSNAKWFQHSECVPFKTCIPDDADEMWWCPTCGAKLNGELWQDEML